MAVHLETKVGELGGRDEIPSKKKRRKGRSNVYGAGVGAKSAALAAFDERLIPIGRRYG